MSNTYQSVFERLARTETHSSASKKSRNHGDFSGQSDARSSTGSYQSYSSTPTYMTRGSRMSYRSSVSRGTTRTTPASSSLFNRLHSSETYASAQMKGMINTSERSTSSKRTTSSFFDRMAQTETFASATMKGKLEVSKQRMNRTPSKKKTSSNFFDRMAKTDTFASATMKGSIEPVSMSRSPTPRKSSRGGTTSSFFDRMARHETTSSASKKKIYTSPERTRGSSNPRSVRKSSNLMPSSRRVTRVRPQPQSIESKRYGSSNLSVRSTRSADSFRSARSEKTTRSVKTVGASMPERPRRVSSSNRARTAPAATQRTGYTRPSLSKPLKSALRKETKKPEPKPVVREVLKFESDDELSFGSGDDSDDDDMADEMNPIKDKNPSESVNSSDNLIELEETVKSDIPESTSHYNSEDGKDLIDFMNGATPATENGAKNYQSNEILTENSYDKGTDVVPTEPLMSFDEAPDVEQKESIENIEAPRVDSLDDVLDDSDDDSENVSVSNDEEENLSIENDDEEDNLSIENDDEEDVVTIRCKLLLSDKYHPEYGFDELDPVELNVAESLHAFEEGRKSKEDLCVDLIEALFNRDFENGEHWDIDPGTARELEEDEGGGGELDGRAFVVKQQARLDWNDLYSVAAAKGTIVVWPEKDEIRVENYSYYVAG